jgi:hypothetical protein
VKNTDKAVSIELSNGKFTMSFSGELAGFKEVGKVAQTLSKLIPNRTVAEYMEKLKESDQANEIGKYNVGFIINYQAGTNLSIVAVIGKGKKQDPEGLHSRLEQLHNPKDYRLAKSEGLTELIYAMDALNKAYQAKNEEEIWKYGNSFFRLAKEFPLFFVDSHYFSADSISLRSLEKKISAYEATARLKLVESGLLYELKVIFSYDGKETFFEPAPVYERYRSGIGKFDDKILYFKDFRQAEGLQHIFTLLPFKFHKNQLQDVFNHIILPLSSYLPFEDQHNLIDWSEKGENFLKNTTENWDALLKKCSEKEITSLKGLQSLISHSASL